MAQAAGLPLVPADKRDPMFTTTYGVGELILDAIKRGCRSFIVGIGGSATNDGGTGMLSALGFDFLDKNGEKIASGARGLEVLESVSGANTIPELRECTFRVACDVNNPLCGERGCSAVYAPQKGATPEAVKIMDAWLGKYAQVAKNAFPSADADYPGAGAAGGLGFAFMTFLGGVLESGISIILDETELEFLACAKSGLHVLHKFQMRFAEKLRERGDTYLAEMAERIPWEAPKTLHEGLEAMAFMRRTFGSIEGVGFNSFGRVDLLLKPLYDADIARGVSEDELLDIISKFLLIWDCALDRTKKAIG
jgi:hypothetical protein